MKEEERAWRNRQKKNAESGEISGFPKQEV
jgi:hypothetical protein